MASHSAAFLPHIPSPEEIAALPPDGGEKFNRLVFEQSPYLLQHAANPVDWRPWGEEAFAEARAQDKPVFLSVGYSTCHWCHVMEHESFEDPAVAKRLNEVFIPIKVDREERPDIDHVYMQVTQALTGSGGWPMTVVLTPDRRPFFAGTYFPKDNRFGRASIYDVIAHVERLWKDERPKIMEAAGHITQQMAQLSGGTNPGKLGAETLENAYNMFADQFDDRYGGFSGQRKFPTPHNFSFLIRYHQRRGEEAALFMVEKTLLEMCAGGIWDHVGFGFHRYSTDPIWLLPHFEKMLYDNALMAMALLEAHQVTGKPEYRDTCEKTLEYVLRDMTSAEGGFYSAEDADSEVEEGKFYVWSIDEVMDVLGPTDGELYAAVYSFEKDGNFREESTGEKMGTNIPHLQKPIGEWAKERAMPEDSLRDRLEHCRRKLFAVRERRIHPLKDDKVLTDWNGLMIAAFAKAAKAYGDARYRDAATKACDFVLKHLRNEQGRLLKRWRQGKAGLPAHLDDYAFFIWGLLETYEATFEERYLQEAMNMADQMLVHFWDPAAHGFFQTANDGEQLFLRSKDIYDGAIPSGNAVAALVLLRLSRMTGREQYEERTAALFEAFGGTINRTPMAHAQMMVALDFAQGPAYEIVLAGEKHDQVLQEMAQTVRGRFLPRAVLVHRPADDDAPILKDVELLQSNIAIDGATTAYICKDFACEQPARSFAEFLARLNEMA